MTSSARVALLFPHPLPTAERPTEFDLKLNAVFRVFDPDSAGSDRFGRLQNATVKVFADNDLIFTGVTGTVGNLMVPNVSPAIPPVIHNAHLLSTKEIHFEVLGPGSGSLAGLQYNDGGDRHFPIAKWSTKGWQEPEGHLGTILIDGTTALAPDGQYLAFTVGCFVDATLKFRRSDGRTAPYPANIELYHLVDAQPPPGSPMTLRPGGRLRAHVFEAVWDKSIEIKAKYSASEIPADHTVPLATIPIITTVTGKATIDGAESTDVPGERIGFGTLSNARSIELYPREMVALTNVPGVIQGSTTPNYSDYQNNLQGTYQSLCPDQKEAIFFNWFVELVAYRNLFIRVLTYLLYCSDKVSWTGAVAVTLNMDDGPGPVSATGTSVITAHLGTILEVRDDVYAHELTHAFFNQYITGRADTSIYYPGPPTKSHYSQSYSNEFFAFFEGIADFMGALFVNTDRMFLLPARDYQPNETEDWEKLIDFDSAPIPGKPQIRLGYTGLDIEYDKREDWIGLAVEGAFSTAMVKLWDYIWNEAGSNRHDFQRRWVQSFKGDGTLEFGENDENIWLTDPQVQRAFGYFIIDPIFEAYEPIVGGRLAQRISTRRVVDRIEKRAGAPDRPWADANWSDISQFFTQRWAINRFYISTVQTSTSPECLVVRAEADNIVYRLPEGSTFALINGVTNTITLRGIRIPNTLTVKLVRAGALQAQATVVVATEYDATATFNNLGAGPPGLYDLLFESNWQAPPGAPVLLKDIVVQ